jgi:hypothetical protein
LLLPAVAAAAAALLLAPAAAATPATRLLGPAARLLLLLLAPAAAAATTSSGAAHRLLDQGLVHKLECIVLQAMEEGMGGEKHEEAERAVQHVQPATITNGRADKLSAAT